METTTTLTARGNAYSIIAAFTASADIRQTTRQTYTRLLSAFIEWIYTSGRNVGDITAADIVAYKTHLLATKSTSTASLSIVAIRRFFTWVEEQGGNNVARKVRTPKVARTFKRQHLTASEARALVAAAKNKRDKAIITLMLTTGLREVEVTRLNIADITTRHIVTEDGEEVTRRCLKVWGKGHNEADTIIVMPLAAWNAIHEYLDTRYVVTDSEPLFVGSGNRHIGGRLSTKTIRVIVKAALRAIGLDGKEYSTHSLRHTAAVAALKNGSDITAVQAMLRHSSSNTTQIYIESIKEELRLTHAAEDNAAAYLSL